MTRRIITLLTDFGIQDHYVASIKGVILGINPNCTLIDISHQVRPHDIHEGAFVLANASSYYPKGTIHLAVVDPGVGSPRKPILLVTRNYFFLGPDNGLLSLAAEKDGIKQAIVLGLRNFFLPRISTTFHGRDIFAPVAGHLSLGVEPSRLGNKIDSWVEIQLARPSLRKNMLVGSVVHVDSFGNIISDIHEEQLSRFTRGRRFMIKAGKISLCELKRGYWEAKKRGLMALFGSGGFLEISIREGNAQKILKMKRGDKIRIQIINNQ
jgi:S-adenosylmethionine hydrolase